MELIFRYILSLTYRLILNITFPYLPNVVHTRSCYQHRRHKKLIRSGVGRVAVHRFSFTESLQGGNFVQTVKNSIVEENAFSN